MIGGGVKAYTIVGVCEVDGDPRYLIVDPHYCSSSKSAVAWKRADFFAKSFHNLCTPMLPQDWRSIYSVACM